MRVGAALAETAHRQASRGRVDDWEAKEGEKPMKKVTHRIDYDRRGVDDLAISCDLVHLERMDNNYFWLGIYRGNKAVAVHIGSFPARGRAAIVDAAVIEDELVASKPRRRKR